MVHLIGLLPKPQFGYKRLIATKKEITIVHIATSNPEKRTNLEIDSLGYPNISFMKISGYLTQAIPPSTHFFFQ